MPRDWVKFPELRNNEMEFYYFESPHKQVLNNFDAEVVKVHDGDTITVKWAERIPLVKIRLVGIDAPEMNTEKGPESQAWLQEQLLNEMIYVQVAPERVGKWGRILGTVIHNGINLNELIRTLGFATTFMARGENQLPNLEKELAVKQWL